MAEVNNEDEHEQEHTLPAKRKVDISPAETDNDDDLKKKQKLETCSDNKPASQVEEEVEEDDDDDDDDEEDYESDDDEEDETGDELSKNGKPEFDRKGKGIMKEDKGKGKLIEETDDSSDYESDSGSDSDLSDDPLAEVDLDNIIPSRTRRRAVQPGIYISDDRGNNADDDSDDSDA